MRVARRVINTYMCDVCFSCTGQEKYHSLAPMYYRGAAAAIVVYDITRSVSPIDK